MYGEAVLANTSGGWYSMRGVLDKRASLGRHPVGDFRDLKDQLDDSERRSAGSGWLLYV